MPTPALLLILATLLPLASFVLLMFVGKRMGNPLAGIVATLAIAGSFVCAAGGDVFVAAMGRPTGDSARGRSI